MSNVQMKRHGISYTEETAIDLSYTGTSAIFDQTKELVLDAPTSGTIYGTLLNYQGALSSLGEAIHVAPYKEPPKAPIMYIKPANTVIGHGMPIPCPVDIDELEMGASLGIVIGKQATNVSRNEALNYVEGFTIVNDVSVPHESVYRPAIKQKARDGFCPVGPWIVEKCEVKKPDDLGIRVYINGELKQENTTSNLIRPIQHLIADVTEFMTLAKGDVLLVGVPENAPIAKKGDHVRIEIDEVGFLENQIVAEDEVTLGGKV
ncbi:fumarylacetoacetate hydrolase family protein [Priestia endophytica]|uniref:fumarylacetoacetate hydrolase family protein n=1 Tax=Priestia endophytica TaxID=135735 RepID=UPI000F535ECD|nr:fumarylacetoacetate hydrolase family protein [Priestia endophytica]RPK06299.1 5-carboxymethyl-2-oxo-hex-3- ene-1,7-dioate decarboxylase [Priestia endophytica]